ncbi:MAG TPA: hypothetical protein ENK15_07650 [Thermopetrobacter sp.]|nr:hypothetical protein [Thermopetrobacter sp.]
MNAYARKWLAVVACVAAPVVALAQEAPPPAPDLRDEANATTPLPPPDFTRPPSLPRLRPLPVLPAVPRPPALRRNDPPLADARLTGSVATTTQPSARRDPFAPVGLRAGGGRLFPAIGADVIFTDNLDKTAGGRVMAFGARLTPRLRYESRWSRHRLEVTAAGEIISWLTGGAPPRLEATANIDARLRLDVRRDTRLEVTTGYELGREETGAQRARHDLSGDVLLSHRFGRLRASVGGGADGRFLAPAAGSYNDDYVAPNARLRLSYGIGWRLRPYVEAAADMRRYIVATDSSGRLRHSIGISGEAGVEIAGDGIFSGRLGVKYTHRFYADPATPAAGGVGVVGEIVWRPTRRTRVSLSAGFDLGESTVSGASAEREQSVELALRHGIGARLVLTGGVGLTHTQYLGLARRDLTYAASAAAQWQFSRRFGLTAGWELNWRDSSVNANDYLENRLTLGLQFRM